MAYNKWINTFSTQAEYEEYIAGDVDQYPNIALITATNEIKVIGEEHVPVFSITVYGEDNIELSDGDTINGYGDYPSSVTIEGFMDGETIVTDNYSVSANNGLTFQPNDGGSPIYYIAELPAGYDNTYEYTITATCSGQSVTFNLTYVQPEMEYSIAVSELGGDTIYEYGQLVEGNTLWLQLLANGNPMQEPFDGNFVVECQDAPFFQYDYDRDSEGGVDESLVFSNAIDGSEITISYVQDDVTLASSTYYASVQNNYSLILSYCNPEGNVDNICITQGFCSDSDYYLVLMDGDTIALYDGQTVEYESWGETYHPQLIDPSAGTCVWLCSAFDPSITEVNCYDDGGNLIATLNTYCA